MHRSNRDPAPHRAGPRPRRVHREVTARHASLRTHGHLRRRPRRVRRRQAGSTRSATRSRPSGGEIATTDRWGKRRFAYEINHKTEGFYVVFEIVAEPGALDDLERSLRLADDVVRHKLIRLPDREAARRGLLGEAAPRPTAG